MSAYLQHYMISGNHRLVGATESLYLWRKEAFWIVLSADLRQAHFDFMIETLVEHFDDVKKKLVADASA